MSEPKPNQSKNKYFGIASLFDGLQLRTYFVNYLYFIVGVEILIFLVNFLGQLGPDKGPFPWKFYFYIAFIVPLAITFLLGIFIVAFNIFFFGKTQVSDESEPLVGDEADSRTQLFKLNALLNHASRFPFLPILFVLILGSVLIYKLDAIFLFIFNAGEKMVSYLLISTGVLLGAGLIFGLLWMLTNYRLNKKHMEHEYKYKQDVMKHLGLLVLDDNTVIDKEGKMVSARQIHQIEEEKAGKGNLKVLPPSS